VNLANLPKNLFLFSTNIADNTLSIQRFPLLRMLIIYHTNMIPHKNAACSKAKLDKEGADLMFFFLIEKEQTLLRGARQ